MNRNLKLMLASVVAVALLGSGLLGAAAFAQTPTPPAGQTPPGGDLRPGDVFWTTLASKLGVSVDSLKVAFRDAAKAVVAQRVKDGTLRVKQDAADKLNQRLDKMPLNQPPFPIVPQRKGPSPKERLTFQVDNLMLDTAANTLGMNPRDLMKELRDGMTLAEIAQQKGVDPNKVKTAMLAAVNTRIDEAVKNGKITEDKAKELESKIAAKLDLTQRFPLPGKQKSPQGRWPKP
jgi:ribosomal protein S20